MSYLDELRTAHDNAKAHPYRSSFDQALRRDYISTLFKVSDAYSSWAYHDNGTDLAKKSAFWVHNYNACLSIWRNCGADRDYLVSYYDTMLSVIHRFLETGEMIPVFYNLERDENRIYQPVKYCLITTEEYHGESKHLPGYFKWFEGIRQDVTVEEVANIYQKWYSNMSKERALIYAKDYIENDLPITLWMLEHKRDLH